MNEMIERARIAVDEAMGGHDEFDDDDHRRIAQAVIKAMRVPTDAMVEAACTPYRLTVRDPGDVEADWQAMIDAALAEP